MMAVPSLFTLQLFCVFIGFYRVLTPVLIPEHSKLTNELSESRNVVFNAGLLSESWEVMELLSRPARMQMAANVGKDVNKTGKNKLCTKRTLSQGRKFYLLIIMMMAGDIQVSLSNMQQACTE
jgi:hypothetical protein